VINIYEWVMGHWVPPFPFLCRVSN